MPDHAARQARVPVLAHFGARDAHIPLAGIEAFAKAQPGVSVHLYAAGHGFNCDQRASFDAAAAALARERTLAFLHQHVD
jgi:carboxymethylenebutenolidase